MEALENKQAPGAEGTAGADDGSQKPGNGTQPEKQETKSITLDEKQLADREQRAAKAMIKSMAEQAGLDEAGVQKLLDDYKAKKDAEKTDAQRATERAEKAESELTILKNKNQVLAAGVQSDFAEFVAFQVNKSVTSTTDFPAALKTFLEANPKYLTAADGQKPGAGGYRQGANSTSSPDQQYLDKKYKNNPFYKKG